MGHQSTLSLDHVDNDHRKVEGLDIRSERDKDEEDEIDDDEEKRRDVDQSQQSKRRGDNGKTQDKERDYMTGRNNIKGKASTASRDNKNKGKGHPTPDLITGADCATDTDAKDTTATAASTLPAGALFIHPDMKVYTYEKYFLKFGILLLLGRFVAFIMFFVLK